MRSACYARYSSDLQRDTSIEDQLRVATAYAAAHGWTIESGHVYTDAAISGASIEGRPGLQALLAAVARRPLPFDVLLVDDSSRVARDIADAIRFLQTLTFFGVRVVYISQHIDSANEQAETLVAVHGMVDSLYLREMAVKIRRGLEGQQARGFATGGRTFGYRTVPVVDPSGRKDPAGSGGPAVLGHRIEVHEGEAAIVRQIFEWYAAGDGYAPIVDRLNRNGLRGVRGARWQFSAVRRVLGNERYLGRQVWGQVSFERRPGTRQKVARRVPRERWKVQDRPDLRIVSDDLWARVRARQADVRAAFGVKDGQTLARGRSSIYSPYLFSGLMRCGVCGKSITIVSNGTGGPRYGCPAAWRSGSTFCTNRVVVRTGIADQALVAGLKAELLKPGVLAEIVSALGAALNAVIDTRPVLRKQTEDAIAAAQRKLRNLVDAIEAGAATQTLVQAVAVRETEIARLQAELSTLDEPLESKLAVMPGWVRQQLEDTAGLLLENSDRTKTLFRQLGVRFTLHPMGTVGHGPYYRAEGETDVAQMIGGQLSVSAISRSGARAAAARNLSPAPSTRAARGGPGSSAR